MHHSTRFAVAGVAFSAALACGIAYLFAGGPGGAARTPELAYATITRADLDVYEAKYGERPLVAMRLPPTFRVVSGELERIHSSEWMMADEPLAPGLYAVFDGPTWLGRNDIEQPIPADSRTLIVISRYPFATEGGGAAILPASNQPNPSQHCVCRAFCTLGCAMIDAQARTCYCLSMQPEGENMPPHNINCRKSRCLPRLPNEEGWW